MLKGNPAARSARDRCARNRPFWLFIISFTCKLARRSGPVRNLPVTSTGERSRRSARPRLGHTPSPRTPGTAPAQSCFGLHSRQRSPSLGEYWAFRSVQLTMEMVLKTADGQCIKALRLFMELWKLQFFGRKNKIPKQPNCCLAYKGI